MDVTDVLRDRMHEPAGLDRMTAASAILHAGLVAGLLYMPAGWMGKEAEAPRTVMTISLGGGAPGPDAGGMTQMGTRPIQEPAPVAAKPEPVRPPAAETPAMTVPAPTTKPARPPRTPVKEAPPEARGTTPTRGAETRPGTAVAETPAVRGQGFGLSTGGGSGAGGARLDVSDFCCPEYLTVMIQRIRANWNDRPGPTGLSVVKFTIQRDGRLTDIALEKTSGSPVLDLNAQRALMLTKQLPPLPGQFPNPTLTVDLSFEYTR